MWLSGYAWMFTALFVTPAYADPLEFQQPGPSVRDPDLCDVKIVTIWIPKW